MGTEWGGAADDADRSATADGRGCAAAPAARRRGGLVEAELTGRVIGAFYDVYNALGYGFLESVYARALEIELRARGMKVAREAAISVRYKGEVIGSYRADMLVEARLVLELKATPRLAECDRHQLLNYLVASHLEVGLLLHFGPRPSFERAVSTNHR